MLLNHSVTCPPTGTLPTLYTSVSANVHTSRNGLIIMIRIMDKLAHDGVGRSCSMTQALVCEGGMHTEYCGAAASSQRDGAPGTGTGTSVLRWRRRSGRTASSLWVSRVTRAWPWRAACGASCARGAPCPSAASCAPTASFPTTGSASPTSPTPPPSITPVRAYLEQGAKPHSVF